MPRRFCSRANRLTALTLLAAHVATLIAEPWVSIPQSQPIWAQEAPLAVRVAEDEAAAPALAGPRNDEGIDQAMELDGEELTRGPVHEAFAQPVVFDPEPGPVIKQQPPASIEEVPPEEKPVGDNVTWISGYWAWDEEDDRFLWSERKCPR